ncbi:hypothetical protein BJ742DRAFT_898019 [Cladochytrium replicatum]|nr:hypothetical protein BJ742DRAFT_898019 [Cladochytrium replicatum]
MVVTYGQQRERIAPLASGFRKVISVKKGSVVVVFSPNNMDSTTVVYATLGLGTLSLALSPIFVGIAVQLYRSQIPTYTSDELEYQLTSLITSAAFLDIALPAVLLYPPSSMSTFR